MCHAQSIDKTVCQKKNLNRMFEFIHTLIHNLNSCKLLPTTIKARLLILNSQAHYITSWFRLNKIIVKNATLQNSSSYNFATPFKKEICYYSPKEWVPATVTMKQIRCIQKMLMDLILELYRLKVIIYTF